MNNFKWTNPQLPLPADVAECFSGKPKLIGLAVWDEIYRLRTNRLEADGTGILESPWWFTSRTFSQIVGRATRANVRITTSARSGLAVPPRFNTDFDTLVVFQILVPGFAYCGQASPQKWMKDGNTLLSGGMEQLWIPGLQKEEVRFKFFGNIEDRI